MRKQLHFALKYACKYLQGVFDSNDSLNDSEREVLLDAIHKIQSIAASDKLPF